MKEVEGPAGRGAALLCVACMALPWVNPFAGGPSASVQPWLASALCVFLLLAVRGGRLPSFPPSLWLAFATFTVAMRALPSFDAIALLGGLALILVTAAIAASQPQQAFARLIAAAWLIAACMNAAFALLQYFGLNEALAPWVSGSALGEAYGNLRQRNQLASLLAIGLAALLWFVHQGWSTRRALGPLMLLAAASAASASRTGALQWLVLIGLLALWRGPKQRVLLTFCAGGIAAYIIFAALLPALLSGLWGVSGPSVFARFAGADGCAGRRVLWSNVLYLIAQRPWSGWGWGELDYAHYMTLYPGARFCDILDNAHSLPLHLAVELGVPVALAAGGGFLWALMRIFPWREAEPSRQLCIAVLAVILVHSLLEYPLWYGPFQMAFGLSLGCLWPRVPGIAMDRRALSVRAAVVALALATLAYAAWDYHRISQIYLAPEARDERWRDDPLPDLRRSWLFRTQVQFAELTLTPLTRANARWTYRNGLAMLHYSPEPRVIEKVIESASLLGLRDVVRDHAARYRAAFPRDYAAWAEKS